jgi:hypothetical protein
MNVNYAEKVYGNNMTYKKTYPYPISKLKVVALS